MITQVSGLNASGATKDPRRKAQSVKLRNRSNIPYTHNYQEDNERQKRNALITSASIVLGAVLLAVGYFVIAGLKEAKSVAK